MRERETSGLAEVVEANGRLAGILTHRDLDLADDLSGTVASLMTPCGAWSREPPRSPKMKHANCFINTASRSCRCWTRRAAGGLDHGPGHSKSACIQHASKDG